MLRNAPIKTGCVKAGFQHGPCFKGLCGLYHTPLQVSHKHSLCGVPVEGSLSPLIMDTYRLVAWDTPVPAWWDTGQRPMSLAAWVESEPETTYLATGDLEVLWLCISLAALLRGKGSQKWQKSLSDSKKLSRTSK